MAAKPKFLAEPSQFAVAALYVARGGSWKTARYLAPGRDAELLAIIGHDINDEHAPRTVRDRMLVTDALIRVACGTVSDTLPLVALAMGVPLAFERVPDDVRDTLMPAIAPAWRNVWVPERVDKRAVQSLLNGAAARGDALAHAHAALAARFPREQLWCACLERSLLHVLADCVRLRAGSDIMVFAMLCPGFDWEPMLDASCNVLSDAQADVVAMATTAPPPAGAAAPCGAGFLGLLRQRLEVPHLRLAETLPPPTVVDGGSDTVVEFDDATGRLVRVSLGAGAPLHAPGAPLPALAAARVALEWARALVRMRAVRSQHDVPAYAGHVSLAECSPQQRLRLLRNLLHRPIVVHDSSLSYMDGPVARVSSGLANAGGPRDWAEMVIALNAGREHDFEPELPTLQEQFEQFQLLDDVPEAELHAFKMRCAHEPAEVLVPDSDEDEPPAGDAAVAQASFAPAPPAVLAPCEVCGQAAFKNKRARSAHVAKCKKAAAKEKRAGGRSKQAAAKRGKGKKRSKR